MSGYVDKAFRIIREGEKRFIKDLRPMLDKISNLIRMLEELSQTYPSQDTLIDKNTYRILNLSEEIVHNYRLLYTNFFTSYDEEILYMTSSTVKGMKLAIKYFTDFNDIKNTSNNMYIDSTIMMLKNIHKELYLIYMYATLDDIDNISEHLGTFKESASIYNHAQKLFLEYRTFLINFITFCEKLTNLRSDTRSGGDLNG